MRLFLRIFEGLLALGALLVTHQLFWVLSRDLQASWRCPNPPVLLSPFPGESTPIAPPCGNRLPETMVVSRPQLLLRGHAPDRTPIQLWVNEAPVGFAYSTDGRFETEVPLRTGINTVGPSIEPARTGRRPHIYRLTQANYRPEQLTATFLIFHLAVLSWPVFGLSFDTLQSVLIGVGAASWHGRAAETFRDVGRIAPFLVVGVMLLIQPLYAAARKRETAEAPFRLWDVVRFFVLWPAAVVIPVVLFVALVDIRATRSRLGALATMPADAIAPQLVLFGAGALIVWVFLYWFLRVGPGVAVRVRAAVGTSLVMILLPVAPWALDSLAGTS